MIMFNMFVVLSLFAHFSSHKMACKASTNDNNEPKIADIGNFWTCFCYFGCLTGPLSLHLNHLIAWHIRISDQQFKALPIGIFCEIWTQDTLRHLLAPFVVNFEICQFSAIPWPFEYFSKNGYLQKIKFV